MRVLAKHWKITLVDPSDPKGPYLASCDRCDWAVERRDYIAARAATMDHHYHCPNRWPDIHKYDEAS